MGSFMLTPYQFGQFIKQAIGPGEYFKPRSMLPPIPPPSKPQPTSRPGAPNAIRVQAPTLDPKVTIPAADPAAALSVDGLATRAVAGPGWKGWLDQNYQGNTRPKVNAALTAHMRQHPGSYGKYRTATREMADGFAARSPVAFQQENVDRPLFQSGAITGREQNPRIFIGNEDFIGQRHAHPGFQFAGSALSKFMPAPAVTRMLFGKNLRSPAWTKDLIRAHEMEHVNQSDESWESERVSTPNPGGQGVWVSYPEPVTWANRFAHEAPAVLKELILGAEAARQATGTPVRTPVPLSPNYQPDLEWMRSQAQRHGMDLGQGGKLPTELLQTPAGQAWLRYQLRDHADAIAAARPKPAPRAARADSRRTPLSASPLPSDWPRGSSQSSDGQIR